MGERTVVVAASDEFFLGVRRVGVEGRERALLAFSLSAVATGSFFRCVVRRWCLGAMVEGPPWARDEAVAEAKELRRRGGGCEEEDDDDDVED